MAFIRATAADGIAFTGASTTTGLFDAGTQGVSMTQPRLNSVLFHTDGAAVAWTLEVVDPDNATNVTLILSGTSTDMAIYDLLLPTKSDGDTWHLKFSSAVMNGADGWITFDWDQESTES